MNTIEQVLSIINQEIEFHEHPNTTIVENIGIDRDSYVKGVKSIRNLVRKFVPIPNPVPDKIIELSEAKLSSTIEIVKKEVVYVQEDSGYEEFAELLNQYFNKYDDVEILWIDAVYKRNKALLLCMTYEDEKE